ncbi:MAG: DUF1572 family protein [Deinococcota bacterium]
MSSSYQKPSATVLAEQVLETLRANFQSQKRLAEQAMAQLDDAELRAATAEDNSIAVIVKHLHGNMRSRWRDFLTTDGEKPDRQRDAEFIGDISDREALTALWEEGWQTLFEALDTIGETTLLATVTVRGQPHSVLEAILRQLTHYSNHVGQIVYIAKSLKGAAWQSLSIPKGQSQRYTPDAHNKGRY